MTKKGFSYFFVLLFAFLIIEFAFCIKIFKDNSAHMTDYESESYIANQAAETGFNLAIAELNTNFNFATDSCEIVFTSDSGEVMEKGRIKYTPLSKIDNNILVKADEAGDDGSKLSVELNGSYKGKLSVFKSGDAEFKVRLGRISNTKDNTQTVDLDESKIFIALKSVGKFKDKYKCIEGLIEVAYANRFIYFDGDDALLCFGQESSPDKTVLADGQIYGRNHILIGSPGASGPAILLDNVPGVFTGSEGYVNFAYADRNLIEIDNEAATGEAGGATVRGKETLGEKYYTTDTKVKELSASIVSDEEEKAAILAGETFGGLFRDKYNGGRDYDISYDGIKSYYKRLAVENGIYFKKNDTKIVLNEYINNKYKDTFSNNDNGKDPSKYEVVFLDFGEKIDDGDGDDFGEASDNKIPFDKPVDYNGVIYSEYPIVLWGNPDRDTIIYSEYDIYIAGDFNQRQFVDNDIVKQNYADPNALYYEDGDSYESENDVFRQTNPGKGFYWNNCDIISETRVWIDITDPKKFVKNEMLPFIHYEIYKTLFKKVIEGGESGTNSLGPNDEVVSNIVGKKMYEVAREYGVLDDGVDFAVNADNAPTYSGSKSVLDKLYNPDEAGTGGESGSETGEESRGDDWFFKDKNVKGSFMHYLVNILFIPEDKATELLNDFYIDVMKECKPDTEILKSEVRAFIEEKIWPELDENAFVIYKMDENLPESRKGLVVRLYELTNLGSGIFKESDSGYKDDELYIPEMTVNSKKISMGVLIPGVTQRWPCDVTKIDDSITVPAVQTASRDIEVVDTIREVIGNPSPVNFPTVESIHQAITNKYYPYIYGDKMFIRTFGSEMYLRNMTDTSRLPYIGGGYSPHIRKKVFDSKNRTDFELRTFNILDMKYKKIDQKEFNGF